MWQRVPDTLSDEQRLVAARVHERHAVDVWDDGFGDLWVYRESLGVRGVVRARSWEDALACVIDEIMDDADLDPDEEAAFKVTGELPEGCQWRSSGMPSNPRLTDAVARQDLNGAGLDPLTPQLAERLSLEVDLEDE